MIEFKESTCICYKAFFDIFDILLFKKSPCFLWYNIKNDVSQAEKISFGVISIGYLLNIIFAKIIFGIQSNKIFTFCVAKTSIFKFKIHANCLWICVAVVMIKPTPMNPFQSGVICVRLNPSPVVKCKQSRKITHVLILSTFKTYFWPRVAKHRGPRSV